MEQGEEVAELRLGRWDWVPLCVWAATAVVVVLVALTHLGRIMEMARTANAIIDGWFPVTTTNGFAATGLGRWLDTKPASTGQALVDLAAMTMVGAILLILAGPALTWFRQREGPYLYLRQLVPNGLLVSWVSFCTLAVWYVLWPGFNPALAGHSVAGLVGIAVATGYFLSFGMSAPQMVTRVAASIHRPDVVTFIEGLLYGGATWLFSAFLVFTLPVPLPGFGAIVKFLQGHAFDPIAAGAIIGALTFAVNDREAPTRARALTLAMGFVGIITAFTAEASLIWVIVAGTICASLGLMWSAMPPPETANLGEPQPQKADA